MTGKKKKKSTNVVMRPLKDGSGFSPCSASEENVGKRRCTHTKSSVSFNVKVNRVDSKIEEITVSEDYDKLDNRDKKEVVKRFIDDLCTLENEEQLDSVLSTLRNS